MDVAGTSLFFLANYFLYAQGTMCRYEAPAVYFLVVVYVVLGYIVILIPVILCLAVILCLPLVLSVMRYLGIAPIVGVKGATEEMISAIPIVKYRKPVVAPSTEGEINDTCTIVEMEGRIPNTNEAGVISSTGHGPTVETEATIVSSAGGVATSSPTTSNNRGGFKRWIRGFTRKGKKFSNKSDGHISLESSQETDVEYLTLLDPEDAVCAICLCDYEDEEELRKLNCKHYFHKDCVDEWLRLNRNCPLCKRDIEELVPSRDENTTTELPQPPRSVYAPPNIPQS
ncbi:hypothetical protein BGZ76_010556 [Entomortierella beljakovae]|nr:hypothetical protein BGZ76_010556 [Entomortierella beljakovae]